MAIEDVLKNLKPEEARQIQDWHDADVGIEKEHGISEYKKRSSEVNKYLGENRKLKDFLKSKLEYDPDGDLERQYAEAEEELNRTEKPGTKKTDLEQAVKKLEQKIVAISAEKDAAEKKIKVNKITQLLSDGMKDIPSAQYVIKDFIGSGKVDLDEAGENVLFNEADEKIEMAKGLEQFRKANAHLVVINQQPGAGSNAGSRNTLGSKQMHYDEWMKLNAIQRAAFITGGGTTYNS
jgi:hypothetical protein